MHLFLVVLLVGSGAGAICAGASVVCVLLGTQEEAVVAAVKSELDFAMSAWNGNALDKILYEKNINENDFFN